MKNKILLKVINLLTIFFAGIAIISAIPSFIYMISYPETFDLFIKAFALIGYLIAYFGLFMFIFVHDPTKEFFEEMTRNKK